MRILSATLTAGQKAKIVKALVKIRLTQGANDYTYTQTRILSLNHIEEVYSQTAEVLLDNADGTLTSIDFKGYKGVISYGITTSAGDEYSASAPLWVVGSQLISTQGGLGVRLTLAGTPNFFGEDRAYAAYIGSDNDQKTVKDLLTELVKGTLPSWAVSTAYVLDDLVKPSTDNGYVYKCTTAGTSGGSAPAWTTGIGDTITDNTVVWTCKGLQVVVYSNTPAYTPVFDSEDSLIDTFIPKESFTLALNETRLAAIQKLLAWTTCVFRVEADEKVHFFTPTTTGTTYNYEYSLASGEHTFFNKTAHNRLVVPNYIVVANPPEETTIFSSSAADTASSDLKEIREYHHLAVTGTAQAAALATSILTQYQLGVDEGSGLVPLNVGAEVYDYVKITDARENDNRVGNCLYLERRWVAPGWTMELRFGSKLGSKLRSMGMALPAIGSDSLGERYSAALSDLVVQINREFQSIWDFLDKLVTDIKGLGGGTQKTLYWVKIFNGATDTPTSTTWTFEQGLPWTFTGTLYFSPITTDGIVYVIDRGTQFWKYNMGTKQWTKLASPNYSAENCYRSLVLNGTDELWCISDGAASEPSGRRLSRYVISTDTWADSSQAPNMTGAYTANIKSFVFSNTDTIWAWVRGTGNTRFQVYRYVISTATWTVFTAETGVIGGTGRLAAINAAGTIIYGTDLGTGIWGYTIATDAYASVIAMQAGFAWTYANQPSGNDALLWYFRSSNQRYGYRDIDAGTWNDDVFVENTEKDASFAFQFGVSADLADIIDFANALVPELMALRGGALYQLASALLAPYQLVMITKPYDAFAVIAVHQGSAQVITTYQSTLSLYEGGEWIFYYPVAGDYTKIKIYAGIWA